MQPSFSTIAVVLCLCSSPLAAHEPTEDPFREPCGLMKTYLQLPKVLKPEIVVYIDAVLRGVEFARPRGDIIQDFVLLCAETPTLTMGAVMQRMFPDPRFAD